MSDLNSCSKKEESGCHHGPESAFLNHTNNAQNFLFFFTGAFAFSSNCLFSASRFALALSTGSSGSAGSAFTSCLCFSAASVVWRSGVAEAVGTLDDFVSYLPPMVPSFLPSGSSVSMSSESGAGDGSWGFALRPPIVPSLDFGFGFAGDGVGDVCSSSIGVVDIGVGDFVRARPPSVPRRLWGEGADDVGGWGVWLFSREGSLDVDVAGFWEAWDGPSRSSSSSSVSSSWVNGPRVVMACAVGFEGGGIGDFLILAVAGSPVFFCRA